MHIHTKTRLADLADAHPGWRHLTVRVEGDRVDRDIMAAQLILTDNTEPSATASRRRARTAGWP
jgi:hypothetical protein